MAGSVFDFELVAPFIVDGCCGNGLLKSMWALATSLALLRLPWRDRHYGFWMLPL